MISEGKVIFECDPIFRANYEEKVVKEYLDFKHIEEIFSKALFRSFIMKKFYQNINIAAFSILISHI